MLLPVITPNLFEHLEELSDPRVDRHKIYPLQEILFLVISAVISGCEGWKEIKDFGDAKLVWLRRFLPYESGIPVDDTIARVMRRLNTKAFQQVFISWMKGVHKATEGKVIPIDGKTLRRSHNKKLGQSAIHMVSAFCAENGVVLGQEKVDDKSNEITAIPDLLSVLELKGGIVTIDAMGCQKAIAQKIVDKKADYVLAIKENQKGLFEETKDLFEQAQKTNFKHVKTNYHSTLDNEHGRIEKRECWVADIKSQYFSFAQKWAGAQHIAMVKSTVTRGEKTSCEVRFFITSLLMCATTILGAVRAHWSIENSLHWVLDVTFREDESRIRTEDSAQNLAVMRHIALNILRSDKTKKASIKRKRLMAILDDEYRETLIRQLN
jgi:predicted transposase YbfD/YdcC